MTKVSLTLVMLALCVGCASMGRDNSVTYDVHVSSFGNSNYPPNATFVIVSGNTAIPSSDPEFQEYASYLQGVLEQKGFKSAASGTGADFEVTLTYGVSDPSTQLDSATSSGSGYALGRRSALYRGRTSYNYRTTYTRFANIAAYDLATYRSSGQWKLVWRTQLVSPGPLSDLRRVFPYLLAGGYNNLGEDSGLEQDIHVTEDSPEMQRVRGSMAPPPLQ